MESTGSVVLFFFGLVGFVSASIDRLIRIKNRVKSFLSCIIYSLIGYLKRLNDDKIVQPFKNQAMLFTIQKTDILKGMNYNIFHRLTPLLKASQAA